jgi:hypothetical protein
VEVDPVLLGERLVAEKVAEVDNDELQQEAAAVQSELYNLWLCDRTDDNCCISTSCWNYALEAIIKMLLL